MKSISTIHLSVLKDTSIQYETDRLYEAGFDSTRSFPKTEALIDPTKELRDVLSVNQICFECMGVTLNNTSQVVKEMMIETAFWDKKVEKRVVSLYMGKVPKLHGAVSSTQAYPAIFYDHRNITSYS